MKTKIYSVILIIITVVGCNYNTKNDNNKIIQKEFEQWNSESSELGVQLEVNQFKNWDDLIKRTEQIVCQDSIPYINLKTSKKLKTIYIESHCWEKDSNLMIKERNVLEIKNNSIYKNNAEPLPLDSLESLLKRDIFNNGKNKNLSENSEKLKVFIYYNNDKFKTLPNTLNQLTETYLKITDKTNINIWIIDKDKFKLPLKPKVSSKLNN